MSAQLNTVSGTIYKDFFVNILNIKVSEFTASIIMKCTVVVIGFVCVILVFVVEQLKEVLQVSLIVTAFGYQVITSLLFKHQHFLVSTQPDRSDEWSVIVSVHIRHLLSLGKLQSELKNYDLKSYVFILFII